MRKDNKKIEFQLKMEHLIHLIRGGYFIYRQGDYEFRIYPPETDKVTIRREEYESLKNHQGIGFDLESSYKDMSNELLLEVAFDSLKFIRNYNWEQRLDRSDFAEKAEKSLEELISELRFRMISGQK